MSWLYNQLPVDESTFPQEAIGFIYLITNLDSGRRYIGKKLLHFSKTSVKTVTLKSGVKKKKKIKSKVPSDWKTYWSSSPNVIADVAKLGEDKFRREILFFCSNKGSLGYWEAKLQMEHSVLESQDRWYNGIVSCRVHSSHVKPKLL